MNDILDTAENTTSLEKRWFDELVATVRTHELQLETNTADKKMKSFYQTLMEGNFDELSSQNRLIAQKHFVSKIIVEYVERLKPNFPNKLAFDFNDSEILVWAEIEDNSEALEYNLLKVQAELNAKYHSFGYDIESTIVEMADQLSVPNHYISFK